MKATWNNKTAAQIVTWTYVDYAGHPILGKPINPGDSHSETLANAPSAVGFMGTFNATVYVVIPGTLGGDMTATANDQPS